MKRTFTLLITLLLLFFIQNNLWAEGSSDLIPSDPGVVQGTLSNGMKYFIVKNKTPEKRAILRLAVNAGSILEDNDQLGMAHFLEHMAFNGTEAYKKNDIVRFLQSIGMQFGPDINAHTSFDETVYKLMIPLDKPENLSKGLDILEQWAFHMSLTTNDIEEERGVIHEEWRTGLGASRRMMDAAYPDIMYKSRYGKRLPIGTEESIENSTPESIRRFYKDWYRPDLMAVIAVGDFNPDQIEQEIVSRFQKYKNPERPRERIEPGVPDHKETVFTTQSDPEATWTAAIIFNEFPKKEIRVRSDIKEELIENLYLTMFNNRLEDIQNSPAPPFTYAYVDFSALTRPKMFHTMTVVTAEGQLYKGFEQILTEEKRIRDHGFTESELLRARKELYSQMFKAYNNRNNRESADIAEDYLHHFLNHDPAPGMDYLWAAFNDYIETITLDDISNRAKLWLTEANRVIYTMSPQKKGVDPIDPVRLSGINYRVNQTETEKPEEQILSSSLMKTLPKAGSITSRRVLEGSDIQEWTLSNGAKVVLKHTKFKENEVLFSSMSPGGTSLAEDPDYLSASFASQVILQSGVSDFSKQDLERQLAGSTAKLKPVLGELSSGVKGSSTREDLETLFQLNYLYSTSPRLDLPIWNSYKTRLRDSLKNRDSNPMTRYSDLLISLLYQDNLRSRPLTAEMLDKIDPQKAFDFYKERFAQADNFTFFITGSFDEEKIVPLVETYLASLPDNGRQETWKDRGLRYPEGSIKKSISAGQDPLSYVTMIYPGNWKWSSKETQVIQAVSDSLQMIITEVVREKAAGTYSPSVSVSPSRVPFEDYYFMISFSCDPKRTEELITLVKNTLDKIRKGDFEERFIQDVIKSRSVLLEEEQQKNSYWQSRMERKYFLDLPDNEIKGMNDLIGYYTKDVFQDRVSRYLSKTNNLEVILYPEDK